MGGSGREELKEWPHPSLAVLWIVNVRGRKHPKNAKWFVLGVSFPCFLFGKWCQRSKNQLFMTLWPFQQGD